MRASALGRSPSMSPMDVLFLLIFIFGVPFVGFLAHRKNRSVAGWVLLCFVISPILCAIILECLPAKQPAPAPGSTLTVRKCPFCAEEIKADAKICRFCQRDLPELVVNPEDPMYCPRCQKVDAYLDAYGRPFCPHCKDYTR
jgi:Zinc finger found in FPG and IleRS